jgi:hypothetical protein
MVRIDGESLYRNVECFAETIVAVQCERQRFERLGIAEFLPGPWDKSGSWIAPP